MGVLTDKEIRAFLALDIGDGSGDGSGDGDGYGNGNGNGNSDGSGDGSGDGDGYGSGYGDGDGYGSGYGYGDGDGYGNGNGNGNSDGSGDGSGDGDGYGSGYGDGDGYGSGYGYGDGYGIKEINGSTVYNIDNINTIITSIRGNVAQGFLIEKNTKLVPCYIVKENNKFAHGRTLKDAFSSLQEKLYDNSTEEERIEAFKKKFPSYDTKYDNRDLFAYHHVITGSCRMGRESFVSSKGLSLDDKTTVREFVELTKNAYGGEIIKKLPKAYGVTD